jgi:hypothetical protein
VEFSPQPSADQDLAFVDSEAVDRVVEQVLFLPHLKSLVCEGHDAY